MSDVVIFESAMLPDPRLRAIADRVLSAVRLAAVRAIAHSKDPKQYSMPSDAGALEHVFLRRLGSLPAARQRNAVEKVGTILAAPAAAGTRLFRGFAQADLCSAKSAEEQLHALAVPEAGRIRQEEVAGLLATLHPEPAPVQKQGPAPAQKQGPPPQDHSFLDLRLKRVTCFHEMEKPWEWEFNDTIAVGGVKIDALGNVGKIAEIQLGEFDWHHNPIKQLSPPRVLATFDLRPGSSWPKFYSASILLVEKDSMSFGEFLKDLLTRVKNWVAAEAGKAVQSKVNQDIGQIIQQGISMILGGIIGGIVRLFEDDVFPPVNEVARVSSLHGTMANGTLVSDERIRKVELYGAVYEIRYDWVFRS